MPSGWRCSGWTFYRIVWARLVSYRSGLFVFGDRNTDLLRSFQMRGKKLMRKNVLRLTLCALLYAPCVPAEAQQAKKVPRIGYLSSSDPATDSTLSEAIRLALREFGYIEGQNIAIEYRYGEGKVDRFSELAAELVRLKVDVIVVAGGPVWVRGAKNATNTIPIVMMGTGTDPVVAGLIESLARPGGNVTGPYSPFRRTRREAAGAAQGSRSQACPCRGSLQSGRTGHCTRSERGSPGFSAPAWVDSSALGAKRCGRRRESIRCAKQGAARWTLRAQRPANAC